MLKKGYIRIAIVFSLRLILHIFWMIPLKRNRIFFASYDGKQYSCNPKYMFEYLYKQYGTRYEYVWCLNDPSKMPIAYKHIKTVKWHSIIQIFYIMTSKVYIYNLGQWAVIPIRKSQIVINTNHGGMAYKLIKWNVDKLNIFYLKWVDTFINKRLTYMLLSSKIYGDQILSGYTINKNTFLSTGFPRNDILFNALEATSTMVRNTLSIDSEWGIVLYAPTFRGSQKEARTVSDIDVEKLLIALSKRFGKKFIFLYRMHFHIDPDEPLIKNGINVSAYPDMQELLCAAEVLISDYSTCMWDFSFTLRPCFMYAPDIFDYNSERGLGIPMDAFPFSIAKNDDELENNILNFNNATYIENIKRHHKDCGSFEHGNATKRVCDILIKSLEK
jgi:CDP-glycerol glycerophosphotransferase